MPVWFFLWVTETIEIGEIVSKDLTLSFLVTDHLFPNMTPNLLFGQSISVILRSNKAYKNQGVIYQKIIEEKLKKCSQYLFKWRQKIWKVARQLVKSKKNWVGKNNHII